jgi:catechol 2,3-dioxygenase-like lactoylglutathione lyase family enzyme
MVRIRHVAVVVNDAERIAAFYEDVLGFKRLGGRTPNHFPGKAIDMGDGEVQFSLLQRHDDSRTQEWSQNNIGPNHIGVEVDSPSEVATKLAAYDIAVIGPRYVDDDPPTLRYFKFRDPEGVEVDVSISPHVWSVG